MIVINVTKNDQIDKITINGHANYSVSGQDIVCSAVSSIAITSINAILKIDKDAIKYSQADGLLEVDLLKHTDIIDIIIENMIEMFKDLEIQYKKNIKINK